MRSKELVLIVLFIVGCAALSYIICTFSHHSEMTTEEASSLTLIIDFGECKPHVHAENTTLWQWNGNTYIVSVLPSTCVKWIFENISLNNATVYNLLKRACSIANCTLGEKYYEEYESVYITSIGGVENGRENRFWQYWLNGEYGTIGASLAYLHDGDTVQWRFVEAVV